MNSAAPKLHGIEPGKPGEMGKVYFGAAQFIRLLENTYARPGLRPLKNAPQWAYHTFDNRFRFAAEKLWDHHVENQSGRRTVRGCTSQYVKDLQPPSVPVEDLAQHTAALTDIPIYLDLLIVYLRVVADCLANVTPYLYGQKGKFLTRNSFREQREWLVKTRPNFDPKYREILESDTRWFDVLAGNPPDVVGLRDAIIHYRGGVQLMYRPPTSSQRRRVMAMLFSDYKTLTSDLIGTLQRLFQDMCLFLDRFVEHFVQRANKQTKSLIFNVSNPPKRPSYSNTKGNFHQLGCILRSPFLEVTMTEGKEQNAALVIGTCHEYQRHQDKVEASAQIRAALDKRVRTIVSDNKIDLIAEEAGNDKEVWTVLKEQEKERFQQILGALIQGTEIVSEPTQTIAKIVADACHITHIDIRPPKASEMKVSERDAAMGEKIISSLRNSYASARYRGARPRAGCR